MPIALDSNPFAFLVYLQVLARFDLSYAVPVMVGGVVLLASVAGAVIGETIGLARMLGAGPVIAGIVFLSPGHVRGVGVRRPTVASPRRLG